ncbi:MAG: beta-galactosidase, partial [Prevotella sp.]|nr:beta-galactosidase [Prevotella sp.]
PWWLLKKKDVKLRTQDPFFMKHVKNFEKEVGKQLAPLTIQNGGPIIMVQVENEYGSYTTDKAYISEIRDCLRSVGFDKVMLFQCDWSSNFENNALPDLLWTMNFGTGANVLDQFKRVKALRPDAPLMCSEYWSGWFDGWGSAHQTRSAEAMVNGIKTMLDNNISFSLYMTHGGTSFAHWAGANNKGFAPDCTSYDYDAPINEQGAATEKYYQLRRLLQNYSDKKLPPIPKAMPVISIPEIEFNETASLFSKENLPQAIASHNIEPMEQYGQGYGSIMYTTTLPAVKAGALLQINDMCDYAIVYIDGKRIGQLYRGNGYETTLRLKQNVREGARLDIFIEAMGRINYSKLIHDPKGITRSVELLATEGAHEVTYNLKNWEVRLFPVSLSSDILSFTTVQPNLEEPTYYRSTFNVNKIGDTYLDMSTWGKGLVWVNGHCLGRFWSVGPQQTLYLPGCWLRKGKNSIMVLDITGPRKTSVKGFTKPNVSELHREYLPTDALKGNALKEALAGRSKAATVKANTDGGAGNDAAPGAKN